MPQGVVAFPPSYGATLTAEELHELKECERILEFRDAVLAGTHPRIKPPAHQNAMKSIAGRHIPSPSTSASPGTTSTQAGRAGFGIKSDSSASPYYKTSSSAAPHTIKPTKSEINPILLEKSDHLIKAEIQLQRHKLEQALRDQIEQQRLAQKALLQASESLPNFDLTEVLSKALAIVHPSTSVEAAPSVGASSDSFDDNTFYSSQHDTPELSGSPPHGQNSHAVVSADERPVEIHSQNQVKDHEKVTSVSLSQNNLVTALPQHSHSPSRHSQTTTIQHDPSRIANNGYLGTSTLRANDKMQETPNVGPDPSGSTNSAEGHVVQRTTGELLKQAFHEETTSPLIRAHDLSPLAPQPARVSPLAVAREPPIIQHSVVEEPPPAQVAALREKVSENSSTDSSPKGIKQSEKKKKNKEKRNKRKSNANNVDTPESPYIKPEPRSPSPFGVDPLPRPQKRQRLVQYGTELNYDEPRYDQPTKERQERAAAPRYAEPREQPSWGRYEESRRKVAPPYQRVERGEGDYHRVNSSQYVRRASPDMYDLPYPPNEVRSVRTVSHAIADRRDQELPKHYRELPPRASVRPEAERDRSRSPIMRDRPSPIPMGPPRQPVRIVVDEYGREYIDPTPVRQAMAPPIRREVVYERAPLRTVSGRPPIETFEEDGILYRRASPIIAAPRRVVTQPEYNDPEFRQYRQREYSVRPTAVAPPREEYVRQREYSVRPTTMAPPGEDYVRQREYSVRPAAMPPPGDEYIQVRGPPVRREVSHFEEAPREYLRAQTIRPEPIRYEIPREFAGRLQSVRPGSVRPEARREMIIPQSQREYSVHPGEAPRREYVQVAEGDRYYEGPSRRVGEVAYVERPPESSVDLVYADDARRDVYR